jgi:polyhydroxyalkanoate synthesis regulator phasin
MPTQISMIGPRAEPVEQKKPKKDVMDQILEGLQIAQGITGIAVNYQTIRERMADRGFKEQQNADERAGIMTAKDQLNYAKDMEKVPDGTEGSVLLKWREGEKVNQASFRPPQKKEQVGLRTPVKIETVENGKNVTKYVDPAEATGKTFAAPIPAPGKPEADRSNENAMSLRKEYMSNKVTQDTLQRAQYYNQIADTVSNGGDSGAADISLVFSFMKMNDPGSTVREGEYASAENSGGVSDKVRNLYNKIVDGGRLTPEQKANFVKQAETMMKSQLKSQEIQDKQYTELAKNWKLDPSMVIDPTFQQMNEYLARQQNNKVTQAPGEAFAAPADAVPGLDINAIDAELKRRGVQQKGAGGGW